MKISVWNLYSDLSLIFQDTSLNHRILSSQNYFQIWFVLEFGDDGIAFLKSKNASAQKFGCKCRLLKLSLFFAVTGSRASKRT